MKTYTIHETVLGFPLVFHTNSLCFSPAAIDKGTLSLLAVAKFQPEQKVLDLGCGYGVVGITAAQKIDDTHIVMSDIDDNALKLARRNSGENGVPGVKIVQSNGFESITDTDFDWILSNPPYHSDFRVPKSFIRKGFNRLKLGGKMLMVTKRREWYKNAFINTFGGVKIIEADGYSIFEAERRSVHYRRGMAGGV